MEAQTVLKTGLLLFITGQTAAIIEAADQGKNPALKFPEPGYTTHNKAIQSGWTGVIQPRVEPGRPSAKEAAPLGTNADFSLACEIQGRGRFMWRAQETTGLRC